MKLCNDAEAYDGPETPQHPYRLVFLYGCRTAETTGWQRAFGIRDFASSDAEELDRVGAQGFVGFRGEITCPVTDQQWDGWGESLDVFWANWMLGIPLDECVAAASNPNSVSPVTGRALRYPFPVPSNAKIYPLTSPIVIGGYRGVTVDNYQPGH